MLVISLELSLAYTVIESRAKILMYPVAHQILLSYVLKPCAKERCLHLTREIRLPRNTPAMLFDLALTKVWLFSNFAW